MSDIVFQGSYQNPGVITIPGLDASPGQPVPGFTFGESVDFSFPGLTEDDDVKLAISDSPDGLVLFDQEATVDDSDPFIISLDRADISALTPGVYYYELHRTSGDIQRLAAGYLEIRSSLISSPQS